MIESITMKSCATYSDLGTTIEGCKKINFFYGANGSGKSTVGNFLSNQLDSMYQQCEIEWENDSPVDILVYNRSFRERHFKEEIEGIFTFGKSRIEDIAEINKLKDEKDDKKDQLNKYKSSLTNKDKEENDYKERFQDEIWDVILKANKSDFEVAFSGLKNSKEKFYNEVLKRYNSLKTTANSRESLKEKKKILFNNNAQKYDLINNNYKDIMNDITAIECNDIWSKVVVGDKEIPVAKLIQYLGNADWVNAGRTYIKGDNICPFCQQETVTNNFEKELNEFFSGEYEKDLRNIKSLIESYKIKLAELSIELEDRIKKLLIDKDVVDIDEYDNLVKLLNLSFHNNLKNFESKENEPGRLIEVINAESLKCDLVAKVDLVNQYISKHNLLIDNQKTEKENLINEIWSFMLYENKQLIDRYIKGKNNFSKAKTGIKTKINSCQIEINNLNNKITALEKDITSVQPTINEINRLLESYGFTNFKIVPSPEKKHFYRIQRPDGTLATNTLSEGEETFISFLYFMQLAKGSNNLEKVSAKKILVLDDPISSLDSNVLFVVSSLVKSLIRSVIGKCEDKEKETDVEQIFLFTHNVFFHKEASFLSNREMKVRDIHYWIINKKENESLIKSFGEINPIKTSYELLWEEIKNSENTTSSVTIQNAMRRIIENYFNMLGSSIDDKILESFETMEGKHICRSLISWINEGSHTIPEDIYIDSYSDSIDKYKVVFQQIFEKMGHKAHYDMMMSTK